jgi:nucleoside-diphosphate-sugar epimerase
MTNIMGKPAIRAVNKEAVKGDILLSYADTSAARTSLGFKAKRDLETGLQEFIQS